MYMYAYYVYLTWVSVLSAACRDEMYSYTLMYLRRLYNAGALMQLRVCICVLSLQQVIHCSCGCLGDL